MYRYTKLKCNPNKDFKILLSFMKIVYKKRSTTLNLYTLSWMYIKKKQ